MLNKSLYYVIAVLATSLLVLYALYHYRGVKIESLNKDISQLQYAVDLKDMQITTLRSSIQKQNEGIDELSNQLTTLRDKLRLTEEANAILAQNTQKDVDSILSADVSKDNCYAAVEWGYDAAKSLLKNKW